MPRKATSKHGSAWNTVPVGTDGYPAETLALMERKPWWAQAVHEWERNHDRPKWGSRWLPAGFDPYAVCTSPGCADPWCSEPGVIAPGHSRARHAALTEVLDGQRRSPRPQGRRLGFRRGSYFDACNPSATT